MELRDYISETILQISYGINDAMIKSKEEQLDIIINPDVSIGSDGDYVIPVKNHSSYNFERRVQIIEMDISVTVSETEENSVSGGAGITKIIKLGVDASSTGSKHNTSQNRIKFSIPVALPKTETNIPRTVPKTIIAPQ